MVEKPKRLDEKTIELIMKGKYKITEGVGAPEVEIKSSEPFACRRKSKMLSSKEETWSV